MARPSTTSTSNASPASASTASVSNQTSASPQAGRTPSSEAATPSATTCVPSDQSGVSARTNTSPSSSGTSSASAAGASIATTFSSSLPRSSNSGSSTPTSRWNPQTGSSGPPSSSTVTPSTNTTGSTLSPRRAPSTLASGNTSNTSSGTPPPFTGRRGLAQNSTSGSGTFGPAAGTVAAALSTGTGVGASSLFGYYADPMSSRSGAAGPGHGHAHSASTGGVGYARYWGAPVPTSSSTSSVPAPGTGYSLIPHRSSAPSSSNAHNAGSNLTPRLGSTQTFASAARPGTAGANAGNGAGWGMDNPSWTSAGGSGANNGGSNWAPPVTAPRSSSGFEESSVVSFTWTVRDAHLLRDEVERSPLPSDGGRSVSAGAGKSEVWTTQPIFGDGKWKLELVRTQRMLSQESGESGPSGEAHGDGQGTHAEEGDEENNNRPNTLTVLSIYLTSMVLDYSPADFDIPANIMLGIKTGREQVGKRSARTGGWLWQHWASFDFRREHEFYECHELPSLSELLQNPSVAAQDAFSLTIQVAVGPSVTSAGLVTGASLPFQLPGSDHVPRSLVDSLEGLLDSANTGDVRIVVRERGLVQVAHPQSHAVEGEADGQPQPQPHDGHAVQREVHLYPVGAPAPAWHTPDGTGSQVVVRDRILWAHSSVLRARSEYFAIMLESSFAEGQGQSIHDRTGYDASGGTGSGRRVHTLRIPDADFATVYWLLRWLYLDEIEFAEEEDVRSAALDDDWTAASHSASSGEFDSQDRPHTQTQARGDAKVVWEWRDLAAVAEQEEMYTDAAAESAGMYASQIHTQHSHTPTTARTLSARASRASIASSNNSGGGGGGPPGSPSASVSVAHDLGAGPPSSPTHHQHAHGSGFFARGHGVWSSRAPPSRHASSPTPAGPWDNSGGNNGGNNAGAGVGVGGAGPSANTNSLSDPHPHPTARTFPASALSIYRLAHRYALPSLSDLACAHLVGTLTPSTAFPVLLATGLYEDLHTGVKRYVYEHWEEVSGSAAFGRCCDEVSAGEWGIDAGRTLRQFLKGLVSPARIYNRP